MPRLRPRQEIFIKNIINGAKRGVSQREAYRLAGYATTSDNSTDAAASRLLSDVKVRERMDTITRPAIKKSRFTIETLLAEVERNIADAREAKQFAVVTASLALAAKALGMLRDQVEIGGVGEFAGLDTPEQVIEATRKELGEDAARALELMVGRGGPITAADRVSSMLADVGDPREVLALLDEMRTILEARVSSMAHDVMPVQGARGN
jgi:hypothetical protein